MATGGTTMNDTQLNDLFYYAVLGYLEVTIDTEDYDFYLEQDSEGNTFVSHWGITLPTIPSRQDLKDGVTLEKALALSQKPNIYQIVASKIVILTEADRDYASANLSSYGVTPGTLIYNSTRDNLQVLGDSQGWVDITDPSSL